jgi:hypothetical protein
MDHLAGLLTIIIQAGNVLFRVHSSLLASKSSVFQGMFALPTVAGQIHEGGSDENPIILPDVKAGEFAALLEWIYKWRVTPRVMDIAGS